MKVKKNIGIGVLELNETSRTYFFPNGSTIVVNDAIKCTVNKRNTHELMTKQGEVYMVPYKWIAMKYVPVVEDKKSDKKIRTK